MVFIGIAANEDSIRILLVTSNQKLLELPLLNAPLDLYIWQSCYLCNMYLLLSL